MMMTWKTMTAGRRGGWAGGILAALALVVLATGGGCNREEAKKAEAEAARAAAAAKQAASTAAKPAGGGAAAGSSAAATPAGTPRITRADKVKFKDAAGGTAFSVKFMADGAKLVDASEKELARVKVDAEDDRELRIKSPADAPLGSVFGTAPRWKVKDAAGKAVLFSFQRQPDGDYKLEDGQEKLIYKVKRRDYGFEVEDAAGASLVKVKAKDNKTSIRNAADAEVLSTNDPTSPAAVACFALDKLNRPQQAALFAAVDAETKK